MIRLGQWLRQGREQPSGDFGSDRLVDADLVTGAFLFHNVPIFAEVGRLGVEFDLDGLVRRKSGDEVGERSVEQDASVMDNDHTIAQCFDVGHIVAGEEDGGSGAAS